MTVGVLVPAAATGLALGPGGPETLRALAGEPLLVQALRGLRAGPSIREVLEQAHAVAGAALTDDAGLVEAVGRHAG